MPSKDILVCGTLNLETTFPIAGFPLNTSRFAIVRLNSGVNLPAWVSTLRERSARSAIGFD